MIKTHGIVKKAFSESLLQFNNNECMEEISLEQRQWAERKKNVPTCKVVNVCGKMQKENEREREKMNGKRFN